jgi:predicted Zn-dependent protease with MMP-like domain
LRSARGLRTLRAFFLSLMDLSEHRLRWAEREVRRCLDELPPELRAEAEGIPVHFTARPDPGSGLDPDLLGLFSGDPVYAGGETLVPEVTRIDLYLDNLWEYAGLDPSVFVEEVRVTYLHELGHFFGWDEDDLSERGLE